VKAGLFKLQKYREAEQKATRLKRELRNVSKAFQTLSTAHRLLAGPDGARTATAAKTGKEEGP
jgi:hypothetical protein